MKLTPAQQRVVTLMNDGWELHHQTYLRYQWWMSRRSANSTETMKINRRVGDFLKTMGVIEKSGGTLWSDDYKLTGLQ